MPGARLPTGVIARYGIDIIRYGRGSRLTMGNALVARLLRSAQDAGVTLWNATPALRLMVEDARVTGLVVRHANEELALRAKRGVVLATGGFAADPALRAAYFPDVAASGSMVAAGVPSVILVRQDKARDVPATISEHGGGPLDLFRCVQALPNPVVIATLRRIKTQRNCF